MKKLIILLSVALSTIPLSSYASEGAMLSKGKFRLCNTTTKPAQIVKFFWREDIPSGLCSPNESVYHSIDAVTRLQLFIVEPAEGIGQQAVYLGFKLADKYFPYAGQSLDVLFNRVSDCLHWTHRSGRKVCAKRILNVSFVHSKNGTHTENICVSTGKGFLC